MNQQNKVSKISKTKSVNCEINVSGASCMDCRLELNRNLKDQGTSQVIYNRSSHQPCQSPKLGDRFKLDSKEASSAHFHPKIVRNLENVSQKPQPYSRKQRAQSKADELVRYMSSLPGYLERGENLKEKAFNVGVLEWRRLEKWQYNNTEVPQQSYKSSPANSNASSVSSTEVSSSNSGRGHSCSPANQWTHHASLVSKRNTSPQRVSSLGIKSFHKNGGQFQDLGPSSKNYLKVSQSILSTHQCFSKYTDTRGKECKTPDRDPLGVSEEEPREHGFMSISNGNTKSPVYELLKENENMVASCYSPGSVLDSMDDQPKEVLEIRSVASPIQSDSTEKLHHGSTKASRYSFSDASISGVHELSSDIPHSCPLPREAIALGDSPICQPCSSSEKTVIFSPNLLSYSKVRPSPSRSRNVEGKKSTRTLDFSAEPLNRKKETEEDRKVRNPSPIRRLMGRIGRSSKDASCALQSNPETYRISSKEAETSVDSACDKSKVNGKGRSSPLRRLIDPLLKPRASSFDHSIGSPQRDSSPVNRTGKLSKVQGESTTRYSVKVRLDIGSCKTVDIDHPQGIGKCGSSTVQALLQVAVKNGLPLFTFAVDNSSEIFAATMRKLSPGKKDANSWVYTFFTVHEMKKRNGTWLNQGSKDRAHGYIPDVVAQMKVSDVPSIRYIGQNSVDQCTTREFVLLAAKKRQGDRQLSDAQANDELAAIVLHLPKMAIRNSSECDQRTCEIVKFSPVDLKEPTLERCTFSESRDVEDGGCSAGVMDASGLTVVLPGGDHGIPGKGEPSPLIERWRSGGSCDCGGWDLGCRIRVLGSQFSRTTGSDKAQSSTKKFQLYCQEHGLHEKPIFSLSLFKDGIYSVEFDSSVKFLQAFSMCIAYLNGLQPAKFSEFGYFLENKYSEASTLTETEEPKIISRDQQEYPASKTSHPPVSPVGRL